MLVEVVIKHNADYAAVVDDIVLSGFYIQSQYDVLGVVTVDTGRNKLEALNRINGVEFVEEI